MPLRKGWIIHMVPAKEIRASVGHEFPVGEYTP